MKWAAEHLKPDLLTAPGAAPGGAGGSRGISASPGRCRPAPGDVSEARAMSLRPGRCRRALPVLRGPSVGPARPRAPLAACRGLQRHDPRPAPLAPPGFGQRTSGKLWNMASKMLRDNCASAWSASHPSPSSVLRLAARQNCLANEAESFHKPNGQSCHLEVRNPPVPY